jgi:hypothetical protein
VSTTTKRTVCPQGAVRWLPQAFSKTPRWRKVQTAKIRTTKKRARGAPARDDFTHNAVNECNRDVSPTMGKAPNHTTFRISVPTGIWALVRGLFTLKPNCPSMAALREEIQTGAERRHWQKLIDRRTQLLRVYRSGRLGASDRANRRGLRYSLV